ncbi:MAG: penicillin-binding protein 2 [Peptococcaceae bacterium]|nr:penicillin-binding protein 2 [Peptococcaceae bacterium]MDH7524243.1 penicillin-binding protein 2 [Peptococcaceae bacterium]
MGEEKKTKLVVEKSLRVYLGVVLIIFSALFLRISWLQLFKAEIYRNQAVSNTMRLIIEPAPRGDIVDRHGKVLATNRSVFNLSLDYLGLKDQDTDEVINKLVEILDDPEITFESIKSAINLQKNRLFEPIIIKRDVSVELITAIEERRRDLPGVNITAQPQRSYPYGILAGHLLGYVHSIKEELDQPGFEDYGLGDLVGKTGVEKTYEHYLRGKNGYRQMEVTAKNRPVREVRTIPPVSGNKLVLTIDLDLQQALEKSFDETLAKVQKEHPKAQAGAAVVLDVNTGKVLAMASRPALNPDDFNGKPLKQDKVDYYFRNRPPALSNRAIQGSYVPGSTFKPITGMAALESGGMNPQDTVACTGKYWYPPYIKCWGTHGKVNYYSAMAQSCNVYFQEMARRAGITQIARVGLDFGLGGPTGIDLPYESSGLLPGPDWQAMEFNMRANKINKNIDEKIAALEKEYSEKIALSPTDQEKKKLEYELNSKKRLWEQERRIQLEHYTQWHDWDTYNTGIGQGYNQYTVIGMANYVATLANGGKRYKPYTVDRIVSPDGQIIKEFKPELVKQVSMAPRTLEETRKAMEAVTSPGGTAYSLFKHFPANIKVAAKTGTAQPGREGYGKNDYDGLFIAFAPADNPQIAFAGVIEHGWSGSGSIGLVAKAVFEQYFGVKPVELKLNQATSDRPDSGAVSQENSEAQGGEAVDEAQSTP